MKRFVSFLVVLCLLIPALAVSAEALPGAGSKIAMICDTIGTNLFLTQCVDKIEELQPKYGYEYSIIECADTDEWQSNYEAAVHENYDLIIGLGWQSAEFADSAATNYPDAAKYAVVDTDAGNENVASISFFEEQAAYLVGVMAGNAFPDEALYGYIGCFEGPGSWDYRWGFISGVRSVNPDAKFIFNWTNSYTDTAIAYEYAKQQAAAGCTYIFGGAAAADNGIYQAALELAAAGKPIYTNGQDADETTPDNPYILTSQLKNTGTCVGYVIDDFFAGTLTGGLQELGLKELALGATHVTNPGAFRNEEILTDAIISACQAANDAVVKGELDLTLPSEDGYVWEPAI